MVVLGVALVAHAQHVHTARRGGRPGRPVGDRRCAGGSAGPFGEDLPARDLPAAVGEMEIVHVADAHDESLPLALMIGEMMRDGVGLGARTVAVDLAELIAHECIVRG